MPTYEYKCEKCGHIFEIVQKMVEEPLKYCPECKGTIRRIISAAGIVFKGSGFHVTDYGKKDSGSESGNKIEAPKIEKAVEKKVEEPKSTETKSS